MHSKSAIIVGSGIAGLSLACMLRRKGFHLVIMEKDDQPLGASIRNFGMIWPIGQPSGERYVLAMRSRELWQEIASLARITWKPTGSIHVAYHPQEWNCIQEIAADFQQQGRLVHLIEREALLERYPALQPEGLLGGLWSEEECIVDPREAIRKFVEFLQEQDDVVFHWNNLVYAVEPGKVYSRKGVFSADLIFITCGADIHLLYDVQELPPSIVKCKLQMLRMQDDTFVKKLHIPVCGGLSLLHYESFRSVPSWNALHAFLQAKKSVYLKHGIHVMVAPSPDGHYTVGDSHAYGKEIDPFNNMEIYSLILTELENMLQVRSWNIMESWHGVYLKMQDGRVCLQEEMMPGVYLYNGLGGTGMTLSFALSEKLVETL